jgi:hypothetical protein
VLGHNCQLAAMPAQQRTAGTTACWQQRLMQVQGEMLQQGVWWRTSVQC